LLTELSPLHKADRIVAPLMVLHGANDPRVPIQEAEQIVESLQARGRPVEYMRFEDEGHGIIKLKNRLLSYPKISAFLEEHLGSPVSAATGPDGSSAEVRPRATVAEPAPALAGVGDVRGDDSPGA
jgi:acetyl esterase/lipase